MMRRTTIAVAAVLALAACRAEDGPLGGSNGELRVSTDPQGAQIYLDDHFTGALTPDTIFNLGGSHNITAVLDSGIGRYSFAQHVVIQGIEPVNVSGPLTTRCSGGSDSAQCYTRNRSAVTAGNLNFSLNALGAVFLEDGNGQGIVWPAGSSDTYVSTAMPLIAAKVGGKAVALGMYDVGYLAGRPGVTIQSSAGGVKTDQKTWVVPSSTSQTLTTLRGIEIREQVFVDATQPDVAIIRITYRNITNSPLYQILDARGSSLGTEGLTYDNVYLGFGVDPDIGSPEDDVMSYDPDLHAVFAYDPNFADSRFTPGTPPGLVGLRMLSAPNGAAILLNGYASGAQSNSSDWHAGTIDETTGWGIMSGTASFPPDDPDPAIGTLVTDPSDVRMIVSAGPYSLRPAEELTIVVAVALAGPKAGTFTQNTSIPTGNPHDASRAIMQTAADLRQKLTDAQALVDKVGNQ